MAPDVALLESMREYRDDELGIIERFENVSLRSGSTIGVVSVPTGERRSTGWLLCHSFGSEQWHLYATEVAIARRLAAQGFPVLRFQCQGYGDSQLLDAHPSFSSHVADTADALSYLHSMEGVREVGLIGARFGAAVALQVATDGRSHLVALLDPVVKGSRFIRQLLRSRAIVELTADATGERAEPENEQDDLHAILRAGGVVSVRGYTITPEVYEQIRGVDLLGMDGFAGSALIVQVSRAERPAAELTGLADHLRSDGVHVASVVVSGPYAALFGEGHFRPVEGDELGDALVGVNAEIADRVAEWAVAVGI